LERLLKRVSQARDKDADEDEDYEDEDEDEEDEDKSEEEQEEIEFLPITLVPRPDSEKKPTHSLTFRVDQKLPLETKMQVLLLAGAPSCEGPEVTQKSQSRNFTTPSHFTASLSSQHLKFLLPHQPITFSFNHQLHESISFGKDSYKDYLFIHPEIQNTQVTLADKILTIHGEKLDNTTYHIVLKSTLLDTYGLSLKGDASFQVHSYSPPILSALNSSNLIVLDPSAS
jgi:hypothetical protein